MFDALEPLWEIRGPRIVPPPSRANLLLVGDCHQATRDVVERAAAKLDRTVTHEPTVWDAKLSLELSGGRPNVVFVELSHDQLDRCVAPLRACDAFAGAFLVGLTERFDDAAYEAALAAGVDGCTEISTRGVGRLLRNLRDTPRPRAVARGAQVVVADPDVLERAQFANAFTASGYRAIFASCADELEERARCSSVVVVDVATLRDAAGRDMLRWIVRTRSTAVWLVRAPKQDVATLRRELRGGGAHVLVEEAQTSPAKVVFRVNERRAPGAAEARRHARVPYGTAAHFRPVGSRDAQTGFTHNISQGGLFVRTLTPPRRGSALWIELWPPGGDRLVHLEAEVAWVNAPGGASDRTLPPGFGARLTGGTPQEMQAYLDGCGLLARELGVGRLSQAA